MDGTLPYPASFAVNLNLVVSGAAVLYIYLPAKNGYSDTFFWLNGNDVLSRLQFLFRVNGLYVKGRLTRKVKIQSLSTAETIAISLNDAFVHLRTRQIICQTILAIQAKVAT